jgi:ADP-ribose pyrophosphatase
VTRNKPPFKLLRRKKIYSGHYVDFVKDQFTLNAVPGKIYTRELVIHPGAVVILPFYDKKSIVLLRQFRYSVQGDLWEIPAGTLERGENPYFCAKRELEEETGFKARRWKRLSSYYAAPGISDEIMTCYRADDLIPGKKNLDHDERIEHEIVSLKKAFSMMKDGRIRDAKTIVALLWVSCFD